MKSEAPKHTSLLKKALITTLVVAVPGSALLGVAYLIAKMRKTKAPAAELPPSSESTAVKVEE